MWPAEYKYPLFFSVLVPNNTGEYMRILFFAAVHWVARGIVHAVDALGSAAPELSSCVGQDEGQGGLVGSEGTQGDAVEKKIAEQQGRR